MKLTSACLLMVLFLPVPGMVRGQGQAQPEDLNLVVAAVRDDATSLQRNLLEGKRYHGVIVVDDVTAGKFNNRPIASIKSVDMRGKEPGRYIRVIFSIEDMERAAKIKRNTKLAIVGTLAGIVRERSFYTNVPDTDEIRLKDVAIQDGSEK